MINIVVDTNQFLSGFLHHGMMKAVFQLILEDKLQLLVSSELKIEVLKKLKDFEISKDVQNEIMSYMNVHSTLIKPTITIDVCRDPKDNFLLELSEASQADYLITRDKDLLDLHIWKHTKILKPEEFLPLLRTRKLIK